MGRVVRHPFASVAGETTGAIHVAMRQWGETLGALTPSMVKSNGPSLILNHQQRCNARDIT
uniref:Uncharacterized protein n=1 Tax=Oryza glaberrima TaxID=4538 RepID=A0A679BA45_ORYGL|nr:hypothetical protein [Oryza glaberrima]